MDLVNRRLRVERGIVCQKVDDVKTAESQRPAYNHSIVFPDLRTKRRSTATPISLLPCSYLESCP